MVTGNIILFLAIGYAHADFEIAQEILIGQREIQIAIPGQFRAFVFLEDISGELPPYEETYLSVPMDDPMRDAYRELEEDMRKALKAHRGNRSPTLKRP